MRGLELAAACCTLLAVSLLSWSSRWGWAVNVTGNCLWMVWGVLASAWCLVGLNALMAAWGLYGFWTWSRRRADAWTLAEVRRQLDQQCIYAEAGTARGWDWAMRTVRMILDRVEGKE